MGSDSRLRDLVGDARKRAGIESPGRPENIGRDSDEA